MREYLVNLKGYADERGLLVAIESMRTIPFEIKRTYYLTNLNGNEPRGFHAHKNLKQFAICLKGSCRFVMDDGKNKDEFILFQPTQGIKIDPMVWHEMHDFSKDCVLLILADNYYEEADYIRSYDDFRKAIP